MSNISKINMEWQTIAAPNKILFYNNRSQSFETLSCKNEFKKFFKVIMKYLSGCTRDPDKVFAGINTLVERTSKVKPEMASLSDKDREQFISTLKKVKNVTIPQMITKFEKKREISNSLAAQHIKDKVKGLITNFKPSTPKCDENGELPPPAPHLEPQIKDDKTKNLHTNLSPQAIPQEIPAKADDIDSPPPPPPPSFGTLPPPPPAPGAMPPPPPPSLNPEAIKNKKIEKLTQDIKEQKKLVQYLNLVELKKHADYKKYQNCKNIICLFTEKGKEYEKELGSVSLEILDRAISDLEEEMKKAGEEKTVSFMQNGTLQIFDAKVARDTLTEWKKLKEEIIRAKKIIEEHRAQIEIAGKVVIEQGSFKLSCEQIDAEIEKFLVEIPKLIEENKGLSFHQTNLHHLNNNLLKLQGKAPVVQEKIVQTVLNKKPAVDQKAAAADFAGEAAKKIAKKAEAKPSLLKFAANS